MRLQNITAVPHPAGNRIDLRWINLDPEYPGVRLVRRQGTHPTAPEDGVLVAAGEGLQAAIDEHLKGETVYYYSLFPYKGDPPEYHIDRHNRTAAMATAPYDMAGQMYNLIPDIYHRYDAVLPPTIPPGMLAEDKDRGQLRRFLELPGSQLDQLYSFAKAMLDLPNPDKVDGRLLPLLAQWIGWQIDFKLELAAQRNEIRHAPFVYKTIGLIPTVEATIKRLSGWESRTKEFVHNVFLSNRPERLNIWARQRSSTGTWSEPTAPLSRNFAYEGRPTTVREADGTLWLFYHTAQQRQWHIWYKTAGADGAWAPSQPLTHGAAINKYPTAVLQGTTLWVFWSTYTEADQTWHIHYRTRTGAVWSALAAFADPTTARKQPWAVVDQTDGVWLFWLERVNGQWQMKYNRHNGAGWELDPAASFPLDAGADPRVESDPFVLFHPSDANQRLWVFWARQEPASDPGQRRWHVAYRVKQSLNPGASDWSAIRTLPKITPDYHDREPAAVVSADGSIELFWSSNREGSWSLWRNRLDTTMHNWENGDQVIKNQYSQRDPLPVVLDDSTLLIYRSNASLAYTSTVYGATETVDFRYAGSTTAHTQDAGKLALRGAFEDFQTYTYDTGTGGARNNQDWYARDTIGLYLTPDTPDVVQIEIAVSRIHKVLGEFMPIRDRAVFLT